MPLGPAEVGQDHRALGPFADDCAGGERGDDLDTVSGGEL